MFYLLMAALVGVFLFIVGYVAGKVSNKPSPTNDTDWFEAELTRYKDIMSIQSAALRSIQTGIGNATIEAELALNETNRILYSKEIA